jgi:serine/threonine-protein kinase
VGADETVTLETSVSLTPPEPDDALATGTSAGPAGEELRTAPETRGSRTQGTVSNPREAMLVAEARRTRLLAWLAAILVILVAAVLIPMEGHPIAKTVHWIGLGIAMLGSLVVILAGIQRQSSTLTMFFSACCCIGLASSFYYWGVFSSAILVVPIVIYFFAFGDSLAPNIPVLLFCAIPHAVLGALITFGVVADRGVIRPLELSRFEAIAALGIAQFVFLIAFLLARGHRRSVVDAMEQLERAARAIAQREALLAEAKQELDRAMKVGGPGRFTEQTLGSYRLGNLIGRGAMGEVYEAMHVDGTDRAAVKLLTASAGADPKLVQRFLREVAIAASLDVPNVVRVLETPPVSSAVPYLAMELLEGETLADILRERPRMRPDEATDMISDVAAGISAAHEAGIIHRDLKPRNVFAQRMANGRPLWKILDFGVSKLLDRGGTLTRDQIVGTPAYMSPEQARGGDVDQRTDIYALGVIAYRVLTGRPAFSGRDAPSVLYLVTHGMPPRPSTIAPLEPAFDSVLAVALAKDPSKRFQSPEELARAIDDANQGRLDSEIHRRADDIIADQRWGTVS